MQKSRKKVGKESVNASTRAETKRLAVEYPPRTIVAFKDAGWAERAGFVVRAQAGKLVVRAPAASMRAPQKAWGVTVPLPRWYKVPRERIGKVLRHARGRST
jgi:hypothetical protein